MKRPTELEALTRDELAAVERLEEEVEADLRDAGRYTYNTTAGDPDFTDRVKREVLRRAREHSYVCSDLDEYGGFTITAPKT
jgi:hypothetical protein